MRLLWTLLIFGMAGCASVPSANVERVREGMDKDEVLRQAGNPKRTFRAQGQDHWIYLYFEKDQEYSRQVSFEDGRVVKVSRPMTKQNWNKLLEQQGAIGSDHRRGKKASDDAGFKVIDGGPDDVNKP